MKKITVLIAAIMTLNAAAQNCPTIVIHFPASLSAGDALEFSAEVKNASEQYKCSFSLN